MPVPDASPVGAPSVTRSTEYRILGGLMGSSALGGLGQLIGLTGTPLLIQELLGSKTWIGVGSFATMGGIWATSGNVSVKVVPAPTALSTRMRPP